MQAFGRKQVNVQPAEATSLNESETEKRMNFQHRTSNVERRMNVFYLFYAKDSAARDSSAGAAGAKPHFEIRLVIGQLNPPEVRPTSSAADAGKPSVSHDRFVR
jgi:hypothetical protein